VSPADLPRLFVLPPSHYCERARWALDHIGQPYTEERWAVGLHVPLARRMAKGTTLPILAVRNTIIQGSDLILDWTGIGGADPALEQRFEKRIGPLVRQYIYAGTLGDPRSGVRGVLWEGVPRVQSLPGRIMWPVTRRIMVSAMSAHPFVLPELEDRLDAELAWFDERISGRHHLAGGQFGRACLTAASLLAPLARPPECPFYNRVIMPPVMEAALVRWSARPSLRWVNHIYSIYRRPRRDTSFLPC
jgi:glutathione S-transferase